MGWKMNNMQMLILLPAVRVMDCERSLHLSLRRQRMIVMNVRLNRNISVLHDRQMRHEAV
jgi:hypothetical protein